MNQPAASPTLLPQFGLRWFLAFVTLLTIALAWYAWRVQRQRAVVAAIAAKAGFVWYDYQVGDNLFVDQKATTIVPEWLRKTFGDDWFYAVVVADLNGTAANTELHDEDLQRLTQLPALKKLILRDALEITPAGVRALGEVKSLQWIYLHHPAIEAADLRPLRELPELRYLAVTTPLGDAGLAELAQFPALTELEISSEGMTDAGVRQLTSLATLRRLELNGTYRLSPQVDGELRAASPQLGIDDGSFHDRRFGRP